MGAVHGMRAGGKRQLGAFLRGARDRAPRVEPPGAVGPLRRARSPQGTGTTGGLRPAPDLETTPGMHFQNRTSGYSRPLRIEPGQRTTQAQRVSDDDGAIAGVDGSLVENSWHRPIVLDDSFTEWIFVPFGSAFGQRAVAHYISPLFDQCLCGLLGR